MGLLIRAGILIEAAVQNEDSKFKRVT